MQILWTTKTTKNLDQIEKYIYKDNPLAACNIALKIMASVELLREHPSMGRPGRIVGTRELIISDTPYIVPYRIKGDRVEILRVLHGSMQWPQNI